MPPAISMNTAIGSRFDITPLWIMKAAVSALNYATMMHNTYGVNIRVTNNAFDNNGKAVLFFYTDNVLISGNVVTNTLDKYSGTLRFEGGDTNVTITNNTVYNNTGPGARPTQRIAWSHQLTAKEAAAYAPNAFLRGDDNWNPTAEAAKLP